MGRVSRLLVALALGSTMLGAVAPATALAGEAEGAGVMTGQVTVNPTVPLVGCIATNFTFGSTAAFGAFASAAPGAYGGAVNLTGAGGSACEDSSGAAGSVSISSCSSAVGGPGSFGCSLSGSFQRAGPLVVMGLDGSTSVGSVTDLVVIALFVPTNAGMATGSPVTAALAGVFDGGGAHVNSGSEGSCVPTSSGTAAMEAAAKGSCVATAWVEMMNIFFMTLWRYEVQVTFDYADGKVTAVNPNPAIATGIPLAPFYEWVPGNGDIAAAPTSPTTTVNLTFNGVIKFSPLLLVKQYSPRLTLTLSGDGTWDGEGSVPGWS